MKESDWNLKLGGGAILGAISTKEENTNLNRFKI
jgi:hypothetical protein